MRKHGYFVTGSEPSRVVTSLARARYEQGRPATADRRKIAVRAASHASLAAVSRASPLAFDEVGMSRNRSGVKSTKSLVFDLETCGNGDTRWNRQLAKHLVTPTSSHGTTPRKPGTVSHTIFEGTSEIQQLVIARAISGMRIE